MSSSTTYESPAAELQPEKLPTPPVLTRFRKLTGVASTIGVSLGVFGFFAIQGIVLARMLGPTGRGEFAVAFIFAQALMYLGLLGAPEIFARLAANSTDADSVRRSALKYGVLAGLMTFVVCSMLSALTLPKEQRYLLPMAMVCALAVVFQQVRLAVQSVDHGNRAMFRYNVSRLVAGAAFPVGLLICWGMGWNTVPAACWTLLVTSILAIGLCQWGMHGSWIGAGAIQLSDAIRSAGPITGSIAANEVMERLDMVLIVGMLSSTDLDSVGAYAAAVPVASVMMIIPNAAGLYVFNRAARADELPTPKEMWSTSLALILLQVVFGIVLALAIPVILPFLYGERFDPAIQFALALIPAAAIRGLLQAADSYLRARNMSAASIPPRVLGVFVILLTTYLGWDRLGALAVPLGLTLAQLISLFLVLSTVYRDVRRNASKLP